MAQKPSIPKGTRDFTPIETNRRSYIFDTIKTVFNLFGYQPIETPAMENLSTLMGKYGEEGDKLLFKILNSGDFVAKTDDKTWEEKNSNALTAQISEKGLRYDLTVPFARFVVQHQNELSFPFKRYQIQPVWRADRPQKGRYREFYQCDVDVIGSDSLLNELELIQIVEEVYQRLNLSVTLKINNRKILAGIAESIGHSDALVDITVAIDKLDKIGLDAVFEELRAKGISENAVNQLKPIITHQGTADDKLQLLSEQLQGISIGEKGIEEMRTLFKLIRQSEVQLPIELDLSLARGLNYYTGAIFEVKSNEVSIGSITGGGRYDDLTGIFGLKDMSGVGISFGADRIYDVLLQTQKFPILESAQTKLLFVNFGENEVAYILPLLKRIREAGINAELYTQSAKLKKQFSYADQKQIPFVAIVGEEEMKSNKIQLKNMHSGEQKLISLLDLIEYIK
ncbi:MAG: histidine--tRNA ligase [Bacteroidales bacterium]|nr:histidine--tRNA ligase [Bacteroidales bacterium]